MSLPIVTAENYFSPEIQMAYMGASQFKAFDRCEAAALAELLGISQQTYSRYERGQRIPSVETVYVLARLYHVSMDYLAGITDDPQPRW